MPGATRAHTTHAPRTPPSIISAQLVALARVAERYGFEPTPNGLGRDPVPATAGSALRRHFDHLHLAGTILDPEHRARPRLHEVTTLDVPTSDLEPLPTVPLHVQVIDRFPALERCLLCGGQKGETYTICAGCYTTAARYAERTLLAILPGLEETELGGIKTLTHEQFVIAIRRAHRLEPKRRGRLDADREAERRAKLKALAEAERATLLATLRAAADEPGIPPAEQRRRHLRLAAAMAARLPGDDTPPEPAGAEWIAPLELKRGGWLSELAADPLFDAWIAVVTSDEDGDDDREEDEYPMKWLETEWLTAPDRVDLPEESIPLLPRTNTAAGGPEHAAALERNALLDALIAARGRATYDASDPYVEWLTHELTARGGVPDVSRSRRPLEWDADECDRWDGWVDALLGGERGFAPEGIDGSEAADCAQWAKAVRRAASDAPVLPRLDRGIPVGRLRWPHFIREEIEAEFQPWGRWIELPGEEEGSVIRVWSDDGPSHQRRHRRRRLSASASAAMLKRRLAAWAREGRRFDPSQWLSATRCPRPKGTVRAWESEIRGERRRRRFEALAHANAGLHPTWLEVARSQSH